MPGERILLVSQGEISGPAAYLLNNKGYEVEVLEDEAEVVSSLRVETPDLVVAPHQQPFDGLNLARALNTRAMLPPSIILTADFESLTLAEQQRLQEEGFNVLPRDAHPEHLLDGVETCLRERQRMLEQSQPVKYRISEHPELYIG